MPLAKNPLGGDLLRCCRLQVPLVLAALARLVVHPPSEFLAEVPLGGDLLRCCSLRRTKGALVAEPSCTCCACAPCSSSAQRIFSVLPLGGDLRCCGRACLLLVGAIEVRAKSTCDLCRTD